MSHFLYGVRLWGGTLEAPVRGSMSSGDVEDIWGIEDRDGPMLLF